MERKKREIESQSHLHLLKKYLFKKDKKFKKQIIVKKNRIYFLELFLKQQNKEKKKIINGENQNDQIVNFSNKKLKLKQYIYYNYIVFKILKKQQY